MALAGRSATTPPLIEMTAGLPYERVFRVRGYKAVWPTLDEFEVRCEVRKSKSVTSDLVIDLSPFLTRSIDGDDILVRLAMTGRQTRDVRSGYFDMVLSDIGVEDARALRAVKDQRITVGDLITAPQGLA